MALAVPSWRYTKNYGAISLMKKMGRRWWVGSGRLVLVGFATTFQSKIPTNSARDSRLDEIQARKARIVGKILAHTTLS